MKLDMKDLCMKLHKKLMHSLFDKDSELISELIRVGEGYAESAQNFEEQYSQLHTKIERLNVELRDKLNVNSIEVNVFLPILKEGVSHAQEALNNPKIVSDIDKTYYTIGVCCTVAIIASSALKLSNPLLTMEKVREVVLILVAFFIELYISRRERINTIESLAGNLREAQSYQEKLQSIFNSDPDSIFDDNGEFHKTLQKMKTAIEGQAS